MFMYFILICYYKIIYLYRIRQRGLQLQAKYNRMRHSHGQKYYNNNNNNTQHHIQRNNLRNNSHLHQRSMQRR